MKHIKDFERYMITTNGYILDIERNYAPVGTWIDNTGYLQCNLYKDDKKYYRRVHRLVAETFLENPNNLPQVNHKDGNKLNCNVLNLEWSTNSDNTQHAYDNNLYRFKQRCYPVNVYDKYNHEYLKTFNSIRSLCDELHLNRKTVSSILNDEKKTNNYDYIFEYVKEGQTTIESYIPNMG